MFQVTELSLGDAYELKAGGYPDLSIQVGRGGDCGVFIAKCEPATFRQSPAFRVLMSEKDLRKHWRKVGTYEVGNELQHYAFYGDDDIGSEARYKVTLEDLDNRVPIEDAEFRRLERLSVWETVHILARVTKGTKWF